MASRSVAGDRAAEPDEAGRGRCAAAPPRPEGGHDLLSNLLPTLERASPSRLPELMDRPDCDPDRLRDALETLARANRRFGGRRLVLGPAAGLLERRPPGPLRILDVGAGGGDIAEALRRRLREAGRESQLVLADLHERTLRIARRRLGGGGSDGGRVHFVRLTAPRLPFPDDSFDLAYSSTMLHHLERREAVRFLRELARVAGGRWVVSDLRRSWPAYTAMRLLAATLWRRHPFPRRDGPVSVRRAFTPGEARRLAEEAGVAAVVDGPLPFRLRIRGAEAADGGGHDRPRVGSSAKGTI